MTPLFKRLCVILVIIPLVSSSILLTQQPVRANCDPITAKTLKVSSDRARNGTLTAKVTGSSVCDVGVDIKYALPVWGELTVNPADASWISIAGGDTNLMSGGLIPPDGLVAFRVHFSPEHRGVRFTINSISDRAKIMNFFQSVLDIAAPIPGGGKAVGLAKEALKFMAQDYLWIIQSFDRMPHLANIARLKGNMTRELSSSWDEGEFGKLAELVQEFYNKYSLKASEAFLDFAAAATKNKAERVVFKQLSKLAKQLGKAVTFLESFVTSVRKLYTVARGYRSGFIEYAYIPVPQAPPPAQVNNPPARRSVPEAQQSGTPGGVDLIKVCYAYGYTGASNTNNTADGWICTRGNEVWPVDWQQVCQDVYGSNYQAMRIDNTAAGWRCASSGQAAQPGAACAPTANAACLTVEARDPRDVNRRVAGIRVRFTRSDNGAEIFSGVTNANGVVGPFSVPVRPVYYNYSLSGYPDGSSCSDSGNSIGSPTTTSMWLQPPNPGGHGRCRYG